MQNNSKPSSFSENRKKQNKKNLIVMTAVITGVAVIAAGVVVAMALVGRPVPAPTAPEQPAVTEESKLPAASETGSMAVSGLPESEKASGAAKKDSGGEETSSTAKKTSSTKKDTSGGENSSSASKESA